MAQKHGTAGKSTREMEMKRYFSRVFLFLLGIAVVGIFYFVSTKIFLSHTKGIFAAIGLFIVVVVIKIMFNNIDKADRDIYKLEKRARKGAKAEEIVGNILEQLPQGYAVFHDVKSQYGNIDHVVVNKEGAIFLIETKSHHGTVTSNGNSLFINNKLPEKDFISQALNNTFWLKDQIKTYLGEAPYITPIIVFSNAFVRIPSPVKGVFVINKKYLSDLLNRPPDKAKIFQKKDLCSVLYQLTSK